MSTSPRRPPPRVERRSNNNTVLWLQFIAVSLGLVAFNIVYHDSMVTHNIEGHNPHIKHHIPAEVRNGSNPAEKGERPIKGNKNNNGQQNGGQGKNKVNRVKKGHKKDPSSALGHPAKEKDPVPVTGNLNEFNNVDHDVAGLSCEAYGGPSKEVAQELVYWEDIPTDSDFVSPFYEHGHEKYLTFEPDGGGWNNIRCVATFYGLPFV